MSRSDIRIIIAEDEPLVLLGFCEMLRETGYTIVDTAKDGKEALKKNTGLYAGSCDHGY